MELENRVAVVTGAARNIGRAIALELAKAGAAVVVNARTSRDEAEETAQLIGTAGGKALVVLADVSDVFQVTGLVEKTLERFGRLDVLVNNAAYRAESPFESMSLEEWRRVHTSILDASFLCAQACVPHMNGGAIVNIGGLTAHVGAAGRAHVVAAKAGLIGLTRALALELAPKDITVNCVVPGTIDTERNRPGAPDRPAHRRGLPPLGRRGEPAEVAAAVRYLCSPGARYVTGQTLHVNGGGYMA
jgi:3-oxoacyl-[acyl-carrier protein] reductase